MYSNSPLTKIDFYKADHRRQYPHGTTKVYSNGTFRNSRIKGVKEVVFFGMQFFILKFLIYSWNKYFFSRPLEEVVAKYRRRMDNALGRGAIPVDHVEALHKLGYLPLHIKALSEGTLVPLRVPAFTITNTHEDHAWLVNYIETILSNYIWKPCTSATTALGYRRVFEQYFRQTVSADGEGSAAIMWQGHDFSARGMSFEDDAMMSAMAHLLCFYGTDTVWAIDGIEDYYFGDSDKEMIGGSVPATEHSVMCMGTPKGEFDTFRRLITELYPSGIVSIVSDSFDYWQVLNEFLPRLKDEIMMRTGSPLGIDKVVIRPDSGDPVRIICGYSEKEIVRENDKIYLAGYGIKGNELQEWEVKGSVECLWDVFGGSVTAEGYRQMSPKIGLIYGDSITPERQVEILEKLKAKNFASTNIVLGIGSFTYEYVTRDTHGFAMKATYGEVMEEEIPSNGNYNEPNLVKIGREIYKDPKTDNGIKKSARGLLKVYRDEETGEIKLKDRCTEKEETEGLLETVFLDGKMMRTQNFEEIRQLVSLSI